MAIPIRQAARIGWYVLKQRLKRKKRYPLVLMLEPLFRCNLECAGCGKIQFPEEILARHLSVGDCLSAVDECGAPVVSIAGGEPLIHPGIAEIVQGCVKRKKFVYLCTNALLLSQKLELFKPSVYLNFSVHLDGLEARHDELVCREGVFARAVEAIKEAKARGFRVTTNTTIFAGEDAGGIRKLFDLLTELKTDGMMISPGYAYQKAPDQQHFLRRESTHQLFRGILRNPKKGWFFNHSKYYLEHLVGRKDYDCTPWGNPCRSVFGWQRPCYLFAEDDPEKGGGYAQTYRELIETTDWSHYGRASKNERCADCMCHCGYEPTAVADTFRNLGTLFVGGLGRPRIPDEATAAAAYIPPASPPSPAAPAKSPFGTSSPAKPVPTSTPTAPPNRDRARD